MKILNFNLNNFNKFFIWVLALLVTTNIAFAGETEKTKRDTVSAMVMYGETTLLDDLADASLKELVDYMDSILSAENFSFELINKLNLLISEKQLMLELYLNGRIDLIDRLIKSGLSNNKEAYLKLIEQRNSQMADKISNIAMKKNVTSSDMKT